MLTAAARSGSSLPAYYQARRRSLSPLDGLVCLAVFIFGATFGAYFNGRASHGVMYQTTSHPDVKDPQVEYLLALGKKDAECEAKVAAAQRARDRSWESTLAIHRREVDDLKQQLARKQDADVIMAHAKAQQTDRLAEAERRLAEEAGFQVHGLVNARPIANLFSNMVPFNHPQKALLLANKLKKGFSDVDGVAEHVPLSTLDGCRELAVVFTGHEVCYVALPMQEARQPPLTVYRFEQDANTRKWHRLPKARTEAKQSPSKWHRSMHEGLLRLLFSRLDRVESRLLPLLQEASSAAAAIHGGPARKRVKVMCLNRGNLVVFLNFMCSVQRAGEHSGFTSDLVIFTADDEADRVLARLGYRTFREPSFGQLPSREHVAYGDSTFLLMMWLKTVSAWAVNRCGFSLLYLDSDLFYAKDPMPLFLEQDPSYDVVMQDDGARSERFAPTFGNTGLFFVRCNDKTKHLLQSMLFSYEVVLSWKSHQSVFNTLLQEHYLRNSLAVKVLPLDLLPTGKIFHHRKPQMQAYANGTLDFYVYHNNWALHNSDKEKYFRSLGWWLVRDDCKVEEAAAAQDCCRWEGEDETVG